MARVYSGVIRKSVAERLQTFSHFFSITTRKIRATYTHGHKCITCESDFFFPAMKHNGTRGMAWGMYNTQSMVPKVYQLTALQVFLWHRYIIGIFIAEYFIDSQWKHMEHDTFIGFMHFWK